MFAATTNPVQSTGDGLAMALRAGVACADVEFMQFHPTALFSPRMPRPLLSEALRGHGALIRDRDGKRFVDELRPRDVVARAITAKLAEQDIDHVWLDATGLDRFAERFPTIAAELHAAGLDPAHDLLPIAPAAHYYCGGIVTDLDGATSLPGLWAAGEVACTGVHGANRLASNSLLEGMVFGPRIVEAIERGVDAPASTGAMRAVLGPDGGDHDVIIGRPIERRTVPPPRGEGDAGTARARLQREMTRGAGVMRSAASLAATHDRVDQLATTTDTSGTDGAELRNLLTVASALLDAAAARAESRGCHTREEFADRSDAFRVRLLV
jgi:L-aspartate oxidase